MNLSNKYSFRNLRLVWNMEIWTAFWRKEIWCRKMGLFVHDTPKEQQDLNQLCTLLMSTPILNCAGAAGLYKLHCIQCSLGAGWRTPWDKGLFPLWDYGAT